MTDDQKVLLQIQLTMGLLCLALFPIDRLEAQASQLPMDLPDVVQESASSEMQNPRAGEGNETKVELLNRAVQIGLPRNASNEFGNRTGEDEMTLEVATALGADEIYKAWLQDADGDERQFILRTVAHNAALYGRSGLAVQLSRDLKGSPAKLQVDCQIAFALGFENRQADFQQMLGDLERLHKEIASAAKREGPFAEHSLEQWLKCFHYAFESGKAAAGYPIDQDLSDNLTTLLFRDSIRAFRAHHLLRRGKLKPTLDTVRTLESNRLRSQLLQLLVGELGDRNSQRSVVVSEFGRELFESFHQPQSARAYAESSVFTLFEEFDYGVCEPIAEIPLVASEIVENSLAITWPHRSASVLESCIRSGFCEDGSQLVSQIKNRGQRVEWTKSVLSRLEKQNELRAAWSIRQQFEADLNMESEVDPYLARLVQMAGRQADFELAESFLSQIQKEQHQNDARLTIAAHRRNEDDLRLIDEMLPTIYEDFRRDLAAINSEKQLEWLYTLGLEELDERRLLILGDEIKREFELRRDSPARTKVARYVTSAARSMTPLGPSRQRFMEDLAALLGIDLDSELNSQRQLDESIRQLREHSPTSPEQKKEILERCVQACENNDQRDQAFADCAVVCAELGDKQAILELTERIQDPKHKFYALLNCAKAFPPVTTPQCPDRSYREHIQQGGFKPGGLF